MASEHHPSKRSRTATVAATATAADVHSVPVDAASVFCALPESPSYTVSEEDRVPDLVVTMFRSAKIRDILAANTRNDLLLEPTAGNVYLRPDMNFSIVLRAASMVSKLFEMVAAVLSRGGGKESKSSIGFTVVMLRGAPHLAIDVWDDSKTIVVSVRIAADVHVNSRFVSGDSGQFPVFRVSCKSMVDKLSHAKDFHRAMIYQKSSAEDILELLIETPDKPGNVQHETIMISSDEWNTYRLEDVQHEFTLQIAIKNLTQLCKVQNDGAGKLTLSIYDMNTKSKGKGGGSGSGSGSDTVTAAAAPAVPPQSTRERNYYILKLEAQNSVGEISSTLRQISTETERTIDPLTKEVATTVHFVESEQRAALDLMELVSACDVKFRQSFASGFIAAFLSKFDPNKLVTIRLASDQPMAMSYSHGDFVLCQMVAAPKVDEDD